jgi:acyl-CoA synthetase (AMP-forming)/AMP-acid ligase II
MTVQLAEATGPEPRRTEPVSVLDLLDNATAGRGTVYFPAEDREPTPIGDLWEATESSSRWIAANIGPGATVAAVLTNTRACVVALLGAWRAGCTVASLPLPARGMAPEAYGTQLARFCAAAGAHALLVDPAQVPMLGDAEIAVHTYEATLAGGPRFAGRATGALVQFTSGSLGTPKGIHLTLDAVGANCLAIVDALAPGPGDSLCSWLPLSHDMGLIGQLLSSIVAGAPDLGHHSLTLMKPETFMANPRSWLRTCAETSATITVVPNFALELAVRTSRRLGALDLSSLKSLLVGSESVRADSLMRFADAFEAAGFRPVTFCPAYGLAEATVAVTIVRPPEPWRALALHDDRRPPGTPPRLVVSTGSPVLGVEVRVRASEGGVGPVEFRSNAQLSRYIGAELLLSEDGYFATGDVGLIDNGELFVIGRGDEAIIVAGRNVFPDDIETAVQHESIRPGCIAAVAAPDGGLAVVVEPSSAMSATELEAACRGIRTATAGQTGFSPATVAFLSRGSLPKTPSGKLRRLAISRSLATDDDFLARVDFG